MRTPTGRLSKTFPDRKAGELWVHQTKVKIAHGEVGLPKDVTFTEAFHLYYRDQSPGLAAASKDLYQSFWRAHLKEQWGPRLLSSIQTGDLQEWAGNLRRDGLAHGSVERMMGLVSAVWSHAIAAKLVTTNPCHDVRLGKPTQERESRMYTPEEMDLILQACTTPRLRALVLVALGTAFRRSEMMAMEWSWIDWHRQVINVPASVEGGFIPKGRKPREIPLGPDVEAALREWKDPAGAIGPVFTGVNIQRWGRDIAEETGRIRARQRGIELKGLKKEARQKLVKGLALSFRWHLLRHTANSRMVMAGLNLRLVMAITGHASLRMLEKYSHLAPGAYDELRQRLPGGITAERPKVVELEARRRAKQQRSTG